MFKINSETYHSLFHFCSNLLQALLQVVQMKLALS